MDTEDLIAKLGGHVLNHLLGTLFFQDLLIHCDNILLLEGKASDAVLALLDASLTVDVRFKILLELFLII